MTDPAFMLGGRVEPGVTRWDTNLDADYVAGVVRRAGGTWAHLDAAASRDVASFHGAVAEALDFPDYYGRNLDALNDCLGDVAERVAGVPVLWWDDWQDLAAAEPRVFGVIVDLLGEWLCLVLRARRVVAEG